MRRARTRSGIEQSLACQLGCRRFIRKDAYSDADSRYETILLIDVVSKDKAKARQMPDCIDRKGGDVDE